MIKLKLKSCYLIIPSFYIKNLTCFSKIDNFKLMRFPLNESFKDVLKLFSFIKFVVFAYNIFKLDKYYG